jgi:hypothetical protein
MYRGREEVRRDLGRSMDQKGAALPHCDGRIEGNTVAAVVDSDDRFHRPGSAICSGARGKRRGGCGLYIAAGLHQNGQGINRN